MRRWFVYVHIDDASCVPTEYNEITDIPPWEYIKAKGLVGDAMGWKSRGVIKFAMEIIEDGNGKA